MIKYLLTPVFILILIVLQTTVSDILFFGKFGIEISLVVAIYAGFRLDILRGGVISFFLGFLLDCMTGSITGFYIFLYVLVFLASSLVSLRIVPEEPIFIMIFTLMCGLFEGMMILLLHSLIYKSEFSRHIAVIFMPQVLVISILSPLLFKIFRRVEVFLHGGDAKQYKRA